MTPPEKKVEAVASENDPADRFASGDGRADPRRELWRRGSYEIVGDWLAPASLSVLDSIGSRLRGLRLLDVAAGTGTVAIEAARRGAVVVGMDLTDELVDIARRRAAGVGVRLRWATSICSTIFWARHSSTL